MGTGLLHRFLEDERVQVVALADVNEESDGYWNGAVAGRVGDCPDGLPAGLVIGDEDEQRVLAAVAVDKMAGRLFNAKNRFRWKLFRSLNDDDQQVLF